MPRKVNVSSSSVKASIPTEIAIEAAERVSEIANDIGVKCALAGGIAMHIYGFTRATTDVDIVAQAALPLESHNNLNIGGESYRVKIGKRVVRVDVIVRNDELKK